MRRLLVFVPLILVLAVTLMRTRGPAPKRADAPPDQFSAARAKTVLDELLAENVAHPVGTAANARVRDRIVARFQALGYQTAIQRRFACNAAAVCATVENILARSTPAAATGAPPSADTLAVMAHYDSVGAGPGGSDDAAGVAVLLETARAVRGRPFRNSVIFLVTDGEEAGLLGAEAFVADAALSRDVRMVINIEHRGTSGPSYMFETSRRNLGLIRRLDLALPLTSSLFYTIYDLLPNDTDVTIFKRADKSAVNFGALGNPLRYHTPNDDAAHVDLRTLQHGGGNVLSALLSFGDADLAARSRADAVWFDVIGFFLVAWPAGWSLPIAIFSLLALLFGVRTIPARAITLGVLACFGTVVAAGLLGYGIGWIARLRHEVQWVASPGWAIAAMWLAGLAAALFVTRKDSRATIAGCAIVWHAVAIVLAAMVPGASYLFLVPAAAVTICVLANASDHVTGVVASSAAAVLLFGLALMLYDALGSFALTIVAVLIALVTMFVAPLIADRRVAMAAIALALLCAGASLLQEPYTAQDPLPLPFTYLDDPAQPQPLWIASAMTPAVRAAAPFRSAPAELNPWSRARVRFAAPAPTASLPRVEIERDGNTIRVRSRRGAARVLLAFRSDARVGALRVNGVNPPPPPARFRRREVPGWTTVVVHGQSMEVAIEMAPETKLEAIAADYTYGLPASASTLIAARQASSAAPVHEGDLTVTRARL